jgi:Protein of unknown function (DUF3224)
MKKMLSLTLMVLTLAFVPLVFGAGTRAAEAAPPTSASGTFSPSALPTNVVMRSAGPNTIITETTTDVLSGTLSGTSVFQERIVVRADGSFTQHDVQTFTGTVNGVAGTSTSVLAFSGDATSFHGHFVFVSGTGGLANLRGQGTFEGSTTTGVGTYTGQIKMHP